MGQRFRPCLNYHMGTCAVYCLKDVDLLSGTHGLPEFIAIAATVLLHLWKRNMMISMAGGTAVYMFLVQMVFV